MKDIGTSYAKFMAISRQVSLASIPEVCWLLPLSDRSGGCIRNDYNSDGERILDHTYIRTYVCMYVCIMYASMRVYGYVYVCIYVCKHVCVCMHALCMYVYACRHTCVNVWMHVCRLCMYVCRFMSFKNNKHRNSQSLIILRLDVAKSVRFYFWKRDLHIPRTGCRFKSSRYCTIIIWLKENSNKMFKL
jgi:hypothetical protein